MDAKHRTDHLFIVRIWQEPGSAEAAGEMIWRGSVQHVRSGERIYFRQLADLNEFIRSQLSRPRSPRRRKSDEDADVAA